MATIASLNVDFTANAAQFMKTTDKIAKRAASIDAHVKKLNSGMDMLKGGGALMGAVSATKMIGGIFADLPGIMDDLERGTIRWASAIGRVAEKLPMLGEGVKAGRSIGEAIGDWWQGDRMRPVRDDAARGAASRVAAEGDRNAMREMGKIAADIDATMRTMWTDYDAGAARAEEALKSTLAKIEEVRAVDPKAASRAAEYGRLAAAAKDLYATTLNQIEAEKQAKAWQAKIAEEQTQANKALDERNRLLDEGVRLQEQFATPLEKYIAEVERLDKLLSAGALDLDTYIRAMDAAAAGMAPEAKAMSAAPEVAAVERMSVAGLKQRDYMGASDPQQQIAKNTRESAEAGKRTARGVEELAKKEPIEVRGI